MTIETHVFIEPRDVLGIELECATCGTRLSLKLGRLNRAIRDCPSCGTEWLAEQTQERLLVQKFLGDVDALNSSLQGRTFKLKIQISRPDPATE
jgi:hypothetical protein